MFRSTSISDLGIWRAIRATVISTLPALALVLGLVGCAQNPPRATLYDDLGGQAGVASMIDEIVVELHADPKLTELFVETDDDYFKERLNEQICMLTDGGCEYTGLDMPEAHSGMNLSAAQFNDFVEACRRAMTRAGVSVGNQNRLLAILAPMREDVIHQ